MQTAHSCDQHRRIRIQAIHFAVGVGELDGAPIRVAQIDLPLDDVRPRRRKRVFEIGHEHAHICVQRVDDHLAIDGTGDLHTSIEKIIGDAGNLPITVANRPRLREKVRCLPGVHTCLKGDAFVHQSRQFGLETLDQFCNERHRLVGENFFVFRGQPATDLESTDGLSLCGHRHARHC